jgi:hypothetical protein
MPVRHSDASPPRASETNCIAPTDQPATSGLDEDTAAEVLKGLEKLLQVFFSLPCLLESNILILGMILLV